MTNGIGRVGWRNYVSPLPSPLWDNLTHYYSADNTTNDAKVTYNGTLVNGATYSTGKIGSAFSFDGINDYMSTDTNSIINSYFPHSYSCWVNPSSTSGTKILVGNSTSMLGFRGGNNLTFFQYYVNAEKNSGVSISANTWSMVTVTYKGAAFGSNNVLFYVNGSLVHTGSLGMPSGGGKIFVGSNSAGSGGFYGGLIDEVGVWNRTLTAAEVTELYNAGAGKQYVAPVEASIVSSGLIMNLDARNALSYSGTGTTWTDLSGNGNNGTLINGTSYSSANGGTLVFDGINDYVSATSINRTSLGSTFTLSIWYNKETTSTGGIFEITPGNNSGSPILILQQNSASLSWLLLDGWRMTVPVSINTWYNVVLTYSSNQYKTYINGVLSGSFSGGLSSINGSLIIGSGYPTFSKEKVSAFHVYNRALTQAEITANFNALKGRYGL